MKISALSLPSIQPQPFRDKKQDPNLIEGMFSGACSYLNGFCGPAAMVADYMVNYFFETHDSNCLNDTNISFNPNCGFVPGDKTQKFLADTLFFQKIMLTDFPKFLAKRISPGSERIFDTEKAKVARAIFITICQVVGFNNHSTWRQEQFPYKYRLLLGGISAIQNFVIAWIQESQGFPEALGAHTLQCLFNSLVYKKFMC